MFKDKKEEGEAPDEPTQDPQAEACSLPEEGQGDGGPDAQIVQLNQQVQDYKEKLLRLQADYDNANKRMRKEKEEHSKFANAGLMQELLGVVDNFEAALNVECEDASGVKEGVKMIRNQFIDVLRNHGLEPILTDGKEFDPFMHEAVAQECVEGKEEGSILEEFQRGYTYKGKVLRYAMVKVAATPKQDDDQGAETSQDEGMDVSQEDGAEQPQDDGAEVSLKECAEGAKENDAPVANDEGAQAHEETDAQEVPVKIEIEDNDDQVSEE